MGKKVEEELEDRGDVFISEEDMDDEDEILEEDEEDEELDEDSEEDEESDDEDSEDDEDDDSDEEEDEEEDDTQRIPRSRLNQVINQRNERDEIIKEKDSRINWLEQQLSKILEGEDEVEEEEIPPAPSYDFDAAEELYIEKLLEGEVKEAAKIRKEINKARDDEFKYQVSAARKAAADEAVSTAEQSRDSDKFEILLDTYISEYNFLDDSHKNYNERAVRLANNLMAAHIANGKSKSQALKEAVEEILPLFEVKKEESKKEDEATKRKVDARKKAARASKSQPPDTKSGKGKESRKFNTNDITKMTEKMFNSLTAKEKAILRGDVV